MYYIFQHLTALCLQFNGLCNEALSLLVPGIQKLKQLTALDLSCNSINLGSEGSEDQATNQMASMLSSLPNLRRLDLSNNRTKTKLSRILSGMPKRLEYLKLCGCGLSEGDVVYLKRSYHTYTLRELDISGNNINGVFRHVLDLLLVLQSTLRVLEMEECDLDNQSISTFFHSFSNFQQLQYLNISRNSRWSSSVLDHGMLGLCQLVSLEAVRVSYPTECYSVLNPDYVEENIMEYTRSITHRVEQQCFKIGRSTLKLVFLP
jgi:Leucine-rich repeat (LRR) protein